MELKRIRNDRPLRLQRPVQLLDATEHEPACGVNVYYLSMDEFEEFTKKHETKDSDAKEVREAASKALDDEVFAHIVASINGVTPGNLMRLCPYYLQRHDEVLELPDEPLESGAENIALVVKHLKPVYRGIVLNGAMDHDSFAEAIIAIKKKSKPGQSTKPAPSPQSQVAPSDTQTATTTAPASTQTTLSGTPTVSAAVTSSS